LNVVPVSDNDQMWERGLAPDSGVSATHVPLIHRDRGQAPSHSKFSVGLFLYQGRTRRLEGFMLVLVQRRRQIKIVLLVLRIEGLR